MDIRRALPVDSPGICELAVANYKLNLSATDLQNGFLSAKFTIQQIDDMARDLGIIVARDSDRVVGFACASRPEWHGQPVIVKRMLEVFEDVLFHGRLINEQDVFVYGPVCIDVIFRGRGLLHELYRGLKRELSAQYDVGMGFVAADNPRSLKAHKHGLRMTEVGRFTHEECRYHALAFRVAAER